MATGETGWLQDRPLRGFRPIDDDFMHDFNCHDAEDINYGLLADRTRYLKENPKGVTDMCKSMDDMRDKARNEGKAEGSFKTLLSLVQDGILTLSQAAERMGLSESRFAERMIQSGYSS